MIAAEMAIITPRTSWTSGSTPAKYSAQSWIHAAAALATAAATSVGNAYERYRVIAKTSAAAAPWTNPERSTSGPHWLPSSADTPAAVISAKSAAPRLRTISGASTAGISQTA